MLWCANSNVDYLLEAVDFTKVQWSGGKLLQFGVSGGNPLVPTFSSFDGSLSATAAAGAVGGGGDGLVTLVPGHYGGFLSLCGNNATAHRPCCTRTASGGAWDGAIACNGSVAVRRLTVWSGDSGDLFLSGPGLLPLRDGSVDWAFPALGAGGGVLKYDANLGGYGAFLVSVDPQVAALAAGVAGVETRSRYRLSLPFGAEGVALAFGDESSTPRAAAAARASVTAADLFSSVSGDAAARAAAYGRNYASAFGWADVVDLVLLGGLGSSHDGGDDASEDGLACALNASDAAAQRFVTVDGPDFAAAAAARSGAGGGAELRRRPGQCGAALDAWTTAAAARAATDGVSTGSAGAAHPVGRLPIGGALASVSSAANVSAAGAVDPSVAANDASLVVVVRTDGEAVHAVDGNFHTAWMAAAPDGNATGDDGAAVVALEIGFLRHRLTALARLDLHWGDAGAALRAFVVEARNVSGDDRGGGGDGAWFPVGGYDPALPNGPFTLAGAAVASGAAEDAVAAVTSRADPTSTVHTLLGPFPLSPSRWFRVRLLPEGGAAAAGVAALREVVAYGAQVADDGGSGGWAEVPGWDAGAGEAPIAWLSNDEGKRAEGANLALRTPKRNVSGKRVVCLWSYVHLGMRCAVRAQSPSRAACPFTPTTTTAAWASVTACPAATA